MRNLQQMTEGVQFQNMDSWKGGGDKSSLSIKQIILLHLQKCVANGSVEWVGGYWVTKLKENWTDKEYVPNTREVYGNSIRMLRCLLICNFDEIMKEADQSIQEDLKENQKEYFDTEDKTKKVKQDYHQTKIDLWITLFEELIMLSKRLHFFEESEGEKQDAEI